MITRLYSVATTPTAHLHIFFTGWGTNPEVASHLSLPYPCDYLTVCDYTEYDPHALVEIIAPYTSISIAAWSMGVWAADLLAPLIHCPLTAAIAYCGTPLPMHDEYGIPSQIFEATLVGLNDDNRARFDRRMCGGKELLKVYQSFSQRSTETLRGELLSVFNAVKGLDYTPPRLAWSHAYIGGKDLIVPAANQRNYWEKAASPYTLMPEMAHYPFSLFDQWSID